MDTPARHLCDAHFHVFPAHTSVPGARYTPAYASTLAAWTAAATACGIERGVIVQPSFLGTDNSVLLTTLATQPSRLRAVALVPATVRSDELATLRAAGVRGVRFNFTGVRNDADVLRALPATFWDGLFDADLHLELNVEPGRASTLLSLVPRALTVVLDHFGKARNADAFTPTIADAAARAQHAPVYVKLSAPYRLPNMTLAERLAQGWLDALGPDALLWGSDWPCTNFETFAHYAALRWRLDTWIPDARVRIKILADNPARLYWRA